MRSLPLLRGILVLVAAGLNRHCAPEELCDLERFMGMCRYPKYKVSLRDIDEMTMERGRADTITRARNLSHVKPSNEQQIKQALSQDRNPGVMRCFIPHLSRTPPSCDLGDTITSGRDSRSLRPDSLVKLAKIGTQGLQVCRFQIDRLHPPCGHQRIRAVQQGSQLILGVLGPDAC